MNRCTFKQGNFNCGSYAFNLYKEDIDQGSYCDKHYWQDQAQKARANATAQPAVPDALTIADKDSADYHEGWNDCRALMLEMRKP